MTESDMNFSSMMEEATKLGKAQIELEKRNKKRAAKGRPPLPDPQERADMEVSRVRHKTGRVMVVDSKQAIKLFEKRKAEMNGEDPEDDENDLGLVADNAGDASKVDSLAKEAVEKAIKEAEAARRVADMKNGRINHESVWSDGGQKLEGGDKTNLSSSPSAKEDPPETKPESNPESQEKVKTEKKRKSKGNSLDVDEFNAFKDDLYYRLKESFAGIENTLSDLQGRISEIVTASASATPPSDDSDRESFEELLTKKVPVTFDVGGAKMSFDAITVFHASPCITVVSKIGSATIKPKPGARLKLSYSMDGETYTDDPVTYLGTRFELPMFGLAFIGFIRDIEAGDMDVEA